MFGIKMPLELELLLGFQFAKVIYKCVKGLDASLCRDPKKCASNICSHMTASVLLSQVVVLL